ncbi:MAG: hypothetical protein ROO76_15125 [Terriglobia bacterium]|nr:hypothetical protein [Terriglobia bacterium]
MSKSSLIGDAGLEVFCRQVRNRSRENKEALALLHHNALTGNIMAILRQELDSMVRCIFLLSIAEREYRKRLLLDSISGKPWRTEDGKGKITDRNMVDLSSKLHGWTRNVYAFGCGFIHLSAFHDYPNRDPFDFLTPQDRKDIAGYLRHYHGVEIVATTKFREIEPILPAVFEKISSNLECYIKDLETDCDLTDR